MIDPILCTRHDEMLTLALELRGLLRPTLIADADLAPLSLARQAILTHATNFAGKASVEMLTSKACPLCFVNRENPKHLNLDGWIENAADEALETDIVKQDAGVTAMSP